MSKLPKEIAIELSKLVQVEITCAEALYNSLDSERAALASMDEKIITINSATKQKLIDSLENATSSRNEFMQKHTIAFSSKTSNSLDLSIEENESLKVMFKQLTNLAKKCFDENRKIGQLINRRTQFISHALNSLSPLSQKQELTYGINGNTIKDKNSSSLFSV